MVMVAFGVANVGWLIMRPDPVSERQDAAMQARPELLAGKALVQGSDCMRCHGFERSYVGPTFADIGKRYAARADGAEYIARKIREGGAGEWGRNIMPRHPQITQQQALQMAQWMIALTPGAASASTASDPPASAPAAVTTR
ncbi:c-type cytochrome [Diaphorobacter aerolatus]|uniref:C-type cytochrome n=2 Tax=Diaphorobacter aerolatus TaxID=1288495 RepID=A0A7H0GQL1_9BURK|nr:c-type cytochrome [Diaphorobacter aerolatus]